MTRPALRSLQRTFAAGLLLLAPLALTALVVWKIVKWVEAYSPVFGFWGGAGIALALILLVGWISRTAASRLLGFVDEAVARIPGLGTLYSSLRDLAQALGGKDKRFNKPVWVYPVPGSRLRLVGFVTREDLGFLGARGEVAVFLPMAYNFAGHLVVLPRRQVKPVDPRAREVFGFVATGGLAGGHAAARAAKRAEP